VSEELTSPEPPGIDPRPIRTALAVIRGAAYLSKQGADSQSCRALAWRGVERLEATWEEILSYLDDVLEELGDEHLAGALRDLHELQRIWERHNAHGEMEWAHTASA
jgi:hypothetical protein